jgi:hypothetical protein
VNQASNSAVPVIRELAVPAASGEGLGSATPLSRTSGALGSLFKAVRGRHFRTVLELWVLEFVLFSFALLRRMGYQ